MKKVKLKKNLKDKVINYSKSNILITSAGRRVDLIKSFKSSIKKSKLKIRLYTADSAPNLSSACNFNKTLLKLPKVNDPKFENSLLRLVKKYSIRIIIPTIDNELLKYSKMKERFRKKNVYIIVSEEKLIKQVIDKLKSKIFFDKLGLHYPKIYNAKNVKFPCIIKPRKGSSSIGVAKITNSKDISNKSFLYNKFIVMQYLNKSYEEFTVDLYYDRNNKLRSLIPRKRIEIRGGEVSKSKTIKKDIYNYLKSKLYYLEGAVGCINLQLMKKKDSLFAIEVNARFGGGYPLSYAAGGDYPLNLINEYILDKKVPFKSNWKENLLMLRYDEKILIHEN